MSVTLRLQRLGQKKRPFYRIVAANKSSRRDGRFLEVIGTYNPLKNPALVVIKEDRVKARLAEGAETSRVVEDIIKKQFPGVIEDAQNRRRAKIQANRKARKARAAKTAKPAKEKAAKK